MRRAHDMPFGARVVDGGALFRLWAPERRQVTLIVGREAPRELAMRDQDGWHEALVDGVLPGAPYVFRVDDGTPVPDPASRSNPWGVNAASALVDPRGFDWDDAAWKGRPWREAVICELHIGAFTPEGTFKAAIEKLDHLAETGITAIELMPVSDFSGRRNWGYDGVLPFAPAAAYGAPDDLKRLVAAAHARGLMVLLDAVYNHFGPEGNHLARYAPQFFDASRHTPWGAAINFDGPSSRTVRDFFIHNALYWIEEFHLDGLRLDAVHAIEDRSPADIVAEIARAIDAGPGREREVHLVLENDANEARRLRSQGEPGASAQWNDDWHHAAHVLLTGEREGYYRDYVEHPALHLARALAEGFSYQGERSAHRGGHARGEPSAHLPPEAFVAFLQNHDQVGNRAMGERLAALAPPEALHLAEATLLLAPSVPMLFMGDEFGATTPFLYFCDFEGELARAVRDGRRGEFAAFERFAGATESIPDPNAEETFLASKLDWSQARKAIHRETLARYRALLTLRREQIVPRLAGAARGATFAADRPGLIAVDWTLGDGSRLHVRANFSASTVPAARAPGSPLHASGWNTDGAILGPWSGTWTIEPA